jgi:choline dehydrogenase-like flavoprotein
MMLPTADGAAAPWSGASGLGRGFMDHVQVDAGQVEVLDRRAFHACFDTLYAGAMKHQPRLKLSASAQRRRQVGGVAAHFEFHSRHETALQDAKVFIRGLLGGRLAGSPVKNLQALASAAAVGWPMAMRYLRDGRMYNPADRGVTLRLSAEQRPLATSRLELTAARDAAGTPVPAMTWDVEAEALETMAVFGEAVDAGLQRAGLARIRLDPRLAGRDPGFLDRVGDAYHQMGMARMSASPAEGVVGPDLRVHGTANLYVAGAAVFPSSGFENPTFTAIALGLRLAERLAGGGA